MKIKPIIIIAGEPKSIFFEIFFKSIKLKKYKTPLVLIASHRLLKSQMNKFNFKKKIKLLDKKEVNKNKLDNKVINILNVDLKTSLNRKKKRDLSKTYIKNCFLLAFELIKKGLSNKIINGPINKKKFLDNKYLGVTEYISNKFKKEKIGMLIYNENLSVCPLTTHLPIKLVSKNIKRKKVLEKILIIDNFYRKYFNFRPKIGVTGLNPHCESILKINEDDRIISSAIKYMKRKKIKVTGPIPADTIFLKTNRKKFDVILGMYHDQVLAPIKTLFEHDAINITMGLPFLRVSPDHGPNEKMFGKNISNPTSLVKALNFLDKQ